MKHVDDQFEVIGKRYHRFAKSIRDGDSNAAAEEFAKFCHWMRRSELRISNRTLAAFSEAWIDLFWQCRRFDLMLEAAQDAESLYGNDPEWGFARGEALFNLCRFEEAAEQLEKLTTEDFEEPMLFYLLACLAERRGDDEAARKLFMTAHRLDSKNIILPEVADEARALKVYQECLEELPESLAWPLKEVPVFVSPLPSDDLILSTDPPIDPLVMGLFMGRTGGDPESSWPEDQPRIHLFHKNIAKIAGDTEALYDELRRTLFHEIGHFFGFDEDQLEEMGLG